MKIPKLAKWYRHPITLRFALSLPITALLLLAARQFNAISNLPPLVLGMASYFIAVLVLMPSKMKRINLRACGEFLSANRHLLLRAIACIGAILYFATHRALPSAPVLRGLVEMGPAFGVLAIALSATAQQVIRAIVFDDSGDGMLNFTVGILHNTAVLFFVLWLAGEVGDQAYQQISANPVEMTAAAVLLSVYLLVSKTTGGWLYGYNRLTPPPATASAALSPIASLPATARDIKYVAAHESGHTLCYAALGRLPLTFKVAMNTRMDGPGALGFVTGVEVHHKLVERPFAEWLMLTLLAGKMGEARIQGETTLGSRSDHERWIGVAQEYLSSHSEGIFYPAPRTELEQKHNGEVLHALQAKQLGMLSELFDLNMDIMRQLVEALESKRTLGREDVIPILSKVRLPEGFPLPFGPFDAFSPEWPGGPQAEGAAQQA